MNQSFTVSVVMCFYEAERFLRQALESVLAQTFKDWELLLVDDGSRDTGREIASDMLHGCESQVRLLEHPGHENRGISASRNLALQAARGHYVAFLDADDLWFPDKLERQVELLETHPRVAMTYGPTEYWFGWTGRVSDARRDALKSTCVPNGTILEPPDLITLLLRTHGRAVPGICSLLVRREAALVVGGFDESFPGVFEDQVFLSRIGLHYPALVTDDCTARYRQHDASCCAEAIKTGTYDPALPNPLRGRFLSWLRDLAVHSNCRDKAFWKALHRELRPYGDQLSHRIWARIPRLSLQAKHAVKQIINSTLPPPVPRWIKARIRQRAYVPPPGWVRFGDLRRVEPISRNFGFNRGAPVDRYYIEAFLSRHAMDLHGRTLEAGDDSYTRRLGGDRVEHRDILHPPPGAPGATIVADLENADSIPSDTFDCVVLTQTLQLIYHLPEAIRALHRILRPGGVLLATVPGISQLSEDEWRDSWYWSFTPNSVRRLFTRHFPAQSLEIDCFGNVLAATAFLQGIAAQELRPEELEYRDDTYPLLIGVRAVKGTPQPVGGNSIATA